MRIFSSSSEAIRPGSFDEFVNNLNGEGIREVVVRPICEESFVDVPDLLILLRTGERVTRPVRAANMRFYKVGAQLEANSITGLPILFREYYETLTEFESGHVPTNLDDTRARNLLTIDDRIAQLQIKIPGIRVTLMEKERIVPQEAVDAIRAYARARALDAYGKPVQLSFRYT